MCSSDLVPVGVIVPVALISAENTAHILRLGLTIDASDNCHFKLPLPYTRYGSSYFTKSAASREDSASRSAAQADR